MSVYMYLIVYEFTSPKQDRQKISKYVKDNPNAVRLSETSFVMLSDDVDALLSVKLANSVFATDKSIDPPAYYIFPISEMPIGCIEPRVAKWFKEYLHQLKSQF